MGKFGLPCPHTRTFWVAMVAGVGTGNYPAIKKSPILGESQPNMVSEHEVENEIFLLNSPTILTTSRFNRQGIRLGTSCIITRNQIIHTYSNSSLEPSPPKNKKKTQPDFAVKIPKHPSTRTSWFNQENPNFSKKTQFNHWGSLFY